MFKTFISAWKIPETRRRIINTLIFIALFRIGSFIPIPGFKWEVLNQAVQKSGGLSDLFTLLSFFSGSGRTNNVAIFAMGVLPYINASIIMQLLTVVIPSLERLAKEEGEEGRKKLQKYVRWLAIALALLQGWGLAKLFANQGFIDNNGMTILTTTLVLTAGSMLLIWLGEVFTTIGIGNGVSLVIFIGIVNSFFVGMYQYITGAAGDVQTWIKIILAIIGGIVVMYFTIYAYLAERRIPIQYARQVRGRRVYGGQSTYLPIRLIQAGVLPIIFAMSMLYAPQVILQIIAYAKNNPQWGPLLGWYKFANSIWYYIVMFLLVVFFTYFYNSITYNPEEIAENIQKYGGYIPGIRPGKPTADYLAKVINTLTLPTAIFLGILAVLPYIIMKYMFSGMTTARLFFFGGTSLLIVVGVAIETYRQIESYIQLRHFKGYLNL
ncbi:MAG: preprotein translocase subunit SecY [Dictyoglomi bacterium]|nr:preprotein translocase subunit SecY [Dictyoglomota bacterium]